MNDEQKQECHCDECLGIGPATQREEASRDTQPPMCGECGKPIKIFMGYYIHAGDCEYMCRGKQIKPAPGPSLPTEPRDAAIKRVVAFLRDFEEPANACSDKLPDATVETYAKAIVAAALPAEAARVEDDIHSALESAARQLTANTLLIAELVSLLYEAQGANVILAHDPRRSDITRRQYQDVADRVRAALAAQQSSVVGSTETK